MRFSFSRKACQQIKEIKKKDPELSQKIYKQLSLFLKNPKHPSLRLHKLFGKLQNSYSISITRGYRLTYLVDKEEAVIISIGTHDEVYRLQ